MANITIWVKRFKMSNRIIIMFVSGIVFSGTACYIAAKSSLIVAALMLLATALLAFLGAYASVNLFNSLIDKLILVSEEISQGNTDIKVDFGYGPESQLLNASFTAMIKALTDVVADTRNLTEAISTGQLETRLDTSRHSGGYRAMLEELNSCLDAVMAPINMTAEYVKRIGQGEIPEKITENYNGDFNVIKNSINLCIDGLGGLLECSSVLDKMAVNDLGAKVKGEYLGIFAQVADKTNTIRQIMIRVVKTNNNIAAGEFEEDLNLCRAVGKLSEEDRLMPSFLKSMENILRLVHDMEMLAEAAVTGKLDVRADLSQHQGEYRKVVEGMNNTLDAITRPLNTAAEYIERIAAGDTPPRITDEYNGDFNEIKNNLNTCIEAISILVEEVGVAITAGIEGNLEQRTDAGRAQGVYRKILLGLNETMDALIAPVNEAILVASQMEQGHMNIEMRGNYQGDNARLKDALNSTISQLGHVIGQVNETLGQVAEGNLDIDFEEDYTGDFSGISSAIKLIIKSLNEVLGNINSAAEEVAAGSQHSSDASQQLAQGASEQASAIEQLTSAITEIAAQTKLNASNANQANELALNARDNAVKGNEQMQEMLIAMEAINESSANISKIIKVIDEIAFQTNILALNAAVEAARAGQHGKGFAVVAEEVRNLAARSASAAKETTDLIEGSIRKVQHGTKIANDTAQALNKIVEGVSQASELVADIATASNEQATGIAQVDQGIVQVSQVVQNNSAIAQQSAQASEELSVNAGQLKEDVARFRLSGYLNAPGSNYQLTEDNHRRPDRKRINPAMLEAAASSAAARIALDDTGFGKY